MLGGAALLAGAAIQYHGAGDLGGLEIRLHSQSGSHGPGAQQVMPAPVAAAAGDQLLPRQAAALLGQAGERVIFRQQADDGPPAAVGGGEGGGDVADAPLHLEALLLQHSAVQVGRLLLLERQLRKGPDLICHLGYQICFFSMAATGRLLFCCHGMLLSAPDAPAR